jgi:hypothetical protein
MFDPGKIGSVSIFAFSFAGVSAEAAVESRKTRANFQIKWGASLIKSSKLYL